jgi:HPt (histidine-containing phosphotransfer) domain-containing protein
MGQSFVSPLREDPELADLVAEFVAELPQRVGAMERAAAGGAWEEVRRLAHQLKGAGGSYGFPAISAAAREVENATREPTRVGEALVRLGLECQRAGA